jgi:hypothetical protein
VTVQPPDADGTNGTDGSMTTGSAAWADAGKTSTPRAQNRIREGDIPFLGLVMQQPEDTEFRAG